MADNRPAAEGECLHCRMSLSGTCSEHSSPENPTWATDRLAEAIDRLDNYWHASKIPLPAQLHAEQLANGIASVRDELKALYKELTGEDPWAE